MMEDVLAMRDRAESDKPGDAVSAGRLALDAEAPVAFLVAMGGPFVAAGWPDLVF